MRPLIQHWHSQGIWAIVYIDDSITEVEEEAEAQQVSKMI